MTGWTGCRKPSEWKGKTWKRKDHDFILCILSSRLNVYKNGSPASLRVSLFVWGRGPAAVGGGREADLFLERGGEVLAGGEAAANGDVGDLAIRLGEQAAGAVQPPAVAPVGGGLADLLAKPLVQAGEAEPRGAAALSMPTGSSR